MAFPGSAVRRAPLQIPGGDGGTDAAWREPRSTHGARLCMPPRRERRRTDRRFAPQGDAPAACGDDRDVRDAPQPGREAAEPARPIERFALRAGGAANGMTHRRQFPEGFGEAARDPRPRLLHGSARDQPPCRTADRVRRIAAAASRLLGRPGSGR